MKKNYATIGALKMYYEIHGSGRPLVLIHGGGSTITSTFGIILPYLAKTHQVIAVELQAHGRTADVDRPLSFQQDADDIAALLQQLHIDKASVFGFSNGGQTAIEIALRHPALVDKLIIASSFYKKDGAYPWLWEGMKNPSFAHMPQGLKDAYLKVTPSEAGLMAMFNRDVHRMQTFKDWKDDDIRSIQAPTMILGGDDDVVRPEHLVEMYRLLPHGRLVILPGKHGECLGEVTVYHPGSKVPELAVATVEEFLQPAK